MALLASLPPELLVKIFEYLDLCSLVDVSAVCSSFRVVCRELNPWRAQIARVLRDQQPQTEYCILLHLSWYSAVSTQNWIHILVVASPEHILFHDIPPLPEDIWHAAFTQRFLPSWQRWRKDGTWQRAYKLVLMRIWHRINATCTADEAWTTYLILSRHNVLNISSASSRQYNPHAVLNVYKEQNNLKQSSTTRLVLQLSDIRIIAIGTLGASSSYQINRLAKEFVNPSGVYPDGILPFPDEDSAPLSASSDTPQYFKIPVPRTIGTPMTRSLTMDATPPATKSNSLWRRFRRSETFSSNTSSEQDTLSYVNAPLVVMEAMYKSLKPHPPTPREYVRLTHPRPVDGHRNFPNYTPGGMDLRWPKTYDGTNEDTWVGPMLVTAILVSSSDELTGDSAEELLRRVGSGRSRWVSFTGEDLDTIAPWLKTHIDKRMEEQNNRFFVTKKVFHGPPYSIIKRLGLNAASFSGLADLPNELFLLIVYDHMDWAEDAPRTIRQLSAVSRRFRAFFGPVASQSLIAIGAKRTLNIKRSLENNDMDGSDFRHLRVR
ncbi:SubName: Full=Uncharacterized protein {ECO:0000313/EMBL:CCA71228.1} [Serendipita indica DSM 11827]|nr:SubName: Full=Uncharacterized protein {ECO:0000313/EMBL:CCA71228.1} [Serendipita indica DSM 11827]